LLNKIPNVEVSDTTGDATWFDKLTTKSRLPKNITKISKNLLRYILQLVSELAFPFQGSNAFYAL
jgi:hypothetical protein